MPAGVTDYGTQFWTGQIVGLNSLPSQFYLAMLLQEPGASTDGTIIMDYEPSTGAGYARQSYATGSSNWASDGGNFVTNLNDIDFGYPSAAWGLITHYGLVDASSGGNLYAWGEFLTPEYISPGFHVTIPAGGIVLSLASLDNSIGV